MEKNSKKKAFYLLACYIVSYVAAAVYMCWVTISRDKESSLLINQIFSSAVLIIYFIPLAVRTKYHAKNANIKWLRNIMTYLLFLMLFIAAANVIAIIIKIV